MGHRLSEQDGSGSGSRSGNVRTGHVSLAAVDRLKQFRELHGSQLQLDTDGAAETFHNVDVKADILAGFHIGKGKGLRTDFDSSNQLAFSQHRGQQISICACSRLLAAAANN